MHEVLLSPFETQFFRHAAVAAFLLSVICGPVAVYVVLRRMSFLAGALCHTILPGIAFGYFHGFNLFLSALVSGVFAALGISVIAREGKVKEDAAIGIVFTGMFALGVIYISSRQSFRDLTAILFGNILAVTQTDLWLLAFIAAIIVLVLCLMHKELMLSTLDPGYANSIGIPVERLRLLLTILVALSVVSAIQAVGVILTAALLITPGATAALLTRRLVPMLFLSFAIALFSSLGGMVLSWNLDLPTGPAIVVFATVIFLAALGAVHSRSFSPGVP